MNLQKIGAICNLNRKKNICMWWVVTINNSTNT